MPVWTDTLVANKARKLMQANPDRISFTIRNDSSTDVYYGFDATVSTSGWKTGVKVKNSGGQQYDEDHKGEVWAISTAAVEVTVVESIKGEGVKGVVKETAAA